MSATYDESHWQSIVRTLEALGFQVGAYKRPQLERRLTSFIAREAYTDLAAFLTAIRRDSLLYRRFHTYVTIHVTEFFRDPPYWARFREAIQQIPTRDLRVWSAGCSWGAEPVSAALLLEEMGRHYEIVATDSDDAVLATARQGIYSQPDYERIPPVYRKYFRTRGSQWVLAGMAGGNITYQRHDLVADALPGVFDIVICRNLIIYFKSDVRARVLGKLHGALPFGGLLFLGATETFLEYVDMGFEVVSPSIFRKKGLSVSTKHQRVPQTLD